MSENESVGAGVRQDTSEQTAEEVFACNQGLIDQLREKHGDIEVMRVRGLPGVIVVGTPPRAAWRVFTDQVGNDKVSNATAAEGLAKASVIYPDPETIKGFFDKKPGLPMKIASLAQQLSGAEADVLGKD